MEELNNILMVLIKYELLACFEDLFSQTSHSASHVKDDKFQDLIKYKPKLSLNI